MYKGSTAKGCVIACSGFQRTSSQRQQDHSLSWLAGQRNLIPPLSIWQQITGTEAVVEMYRTGSKSPLSADRADRFSGKVLESASLKASTIDRA